MLLKDFPGSLAAKIRFGPRPVVIEGEFCPLEKIGYPANAALCQRDPQIVVLEQEFSIQPVCGAVGDRHWEGCNPGVNRCFGRGVWRRSSGTDVAVNHDVVFSADLPQLIPMRGMNARKTMEGRVVREGDGPAALGHYPFDLGNHQIAVPDGQHGHWDNAARVGRRPFVDMPVVIRLDNPFSGLLIFRLVKEVACEGREGRKANRGKNAVGIHIANACIN